VDNYPALLRARRRKEKGWDDATREKYIRHRWHVEGVHGRAKEHHGLRRAARRGLAEVRIQCYLTATVMNLKKLAALTGRFSGGFSAHIAAYRGPGTHSQQFHSPLFKERPFGPAAF